MFIPLNFVSTKKYNNLRSWRYRTSRRRLATQRSLASGESSCFSCWSFLPNLRVHKVAEKSTNSLDFPDFSEKFCRTFRDSPKNFTMYWTSFDFTYRIIIFVEYFSAKCWNFGELSLMFELFSLILIFFGVVIFCALKFGRKQQNWPARFYKHVS